MKSAIRLTLILIVVPTYAFAEPSVPYHQEATQVKTAGKIVGRVRVEGRRTGSKGRIHYRGSSSRNLRSAGLA